MNSSTRRETRPTDLKTLFELRKTVPLGTRHVVARFFEAHGQYGVVDASGCLWPVSLRRGLALPEPGRVARLECSAFRPDGNMATKYEDSVYSIRVESVLDPTPRRDVWSTPRIPEPCPDSSLFPSDASACGFTHFFVSPGKTRRSLIIQRNRAYERITEFFVNRGFLPVETPVLVPSGGVERYLHCFETSYTDHRGQSWSLQLPTSPEFALKKFLVEGHPKVFQLSRAFRNKGELSQWHEPEFHMLEWYRAGACLEDLMQDSRRLAEALAEALESTLDLPPLWPVHHVDDLFRRLLDLDLTELQDTNDFLTAARPLSPSVNASDDWDSLFVKLFLEKVEPFLKSEGACFVTHFPIQMAALAQREPERPFARRFEMYLNGVEICNGYEELTDLSELDDRFSRVSSQRPDVTRDAVFETTMGYGLPPCSGNALGVERLIAVLLGLPNIASLRPFPFLSQFPHATVAPE